MPHFLNSFLIFFIDGASASTTRITTFLLPKFLDTDVSRARTMVTISEVTEIVKQMMMGLYEENLNCSFVISKEMFYLGFLKEYKKISRVSQTLRATNTTTSTNKYVL